MKPTPVHTVVIQDLAAAVWECNDGNGARFHIVLYRLSNPLDRWERTDQFDESESPIVDELSDLAFAWILDNSESRNDRHRKPLGLGTNPAGEGTVCLPVRHHRGQGPDGLSGASREDDGQVRQEDSDNVGATESVTQDDNNNSLNVRDGTASRSASFGVSNHPAVSRLSFLQLASTSLAREGCTPDAPVGANGESQKTRQTPPISGLQSSATCLHRSTHCQVTPLFSGVHRVYRFPETHERTRHE